MRYGDEIKNNFQQHKVYYYKYLEINYKRGEIEVIEWKRENSSLYYIKYAMDENVLFVNGDMGYAVYKWEENVNLEWISKLDLSYFASKCQASERGRENEEWDGDLAEAKLQIYMNDNNLDMEKVKEKNGLAYLYNEQEWNFWLKDYGYDILGEDFYEWASEIGKTISHRCQSHLIGLKMAMEQINAQKNT